MPSTSRSLFSILSYAVLLGIDFYASGKGMGKIELRISLVCGIIAIFSVLFDALANIVNFIIMGINHRAEGRKMGQTELEMCHFCGIAIIFIMMFGALVNIVNFSLFSLRSIVKKIIIIGKYIKYRSQMK